MITTLETASFNAASDFSVNKDPWFDYVSPAAIGNPMKSRIIPSLALGVALLGAWAGTLRAADAPKDDQAFFDKLITAIKNDDYDSFVADGVGSFQKMTQDQFEAAVTQLSPRLNAGYQATYLGAIKKRDGHVALWCMSFKGIEEEALATLSVKDGKISAFTIR